MCAFFGARNDLLVGPSTRLSRSHGKPQIITGEVTNFGDENKMRGDHRPQREKHDFEEEN